MKPLAPGEQVVKVIAEAPSGKATLDLEKTRDAFVSTAALPEGDGYRVVLQIKQTADAISHRLSSSAVWPHWRVIGGLRTSGRPSRRVFAKCWKVETDGRRI